ncbi:protein RTE1-HOMOLOG isoform X2 [Sesbania bispinosa]|nr:protein RTE1-HOMOLOG isoform X2 [Sesbania bispinosa]
MAVKGRLRRLYVVEGRRNTINNDALEVIHNATKRRKSQLRNGTSVVALGMMVLVGGWRFTSTCSMLNVKG